MLTVTNDCVRIKDEVEINEEEVRLKSKESVETLTNFHKTLNDSIVLIRESIPQLKSLIEQVEKAEAKTSDIDGLNHRLEHLMAVCESCENVERVMLPITEKHLEFLLKPDFYFSLKQLHSLFSGKKSSAIGVILNLTYDV